MSLKREAWFVLVLVILFLAAIVSSVLALKSNLLTGPKLDEGVLSLSFDDGLLVQYENAYPLMKEYGFNGTFFILANKTKPFEGRAPVSFEQAREMQRNGWEIGSHTLDHKDLTRLSASTLRKEVSDSKRILESEGFAISSFAYPYGRYNYAVLREVEKNYTYARTTYEGFNDRRNLNSLELKAKIVKRATNIDRVCNDVNYTKENNLWLILYLHAVDKEVGPYDISVEKFRKLLDCVNSSGIKVQTIKEVFDSL